MNKNLRLSKLRTHLFQALPWLFFAICFISWTVFFISRVATLIDSDMSSELILAKHLAESDNFLLSNEWIYSTEIRILHQQAIFSFLFLFFDDWFVVRTLGTIFLYIAYLASWYFLCRRLQMRKAFPITAGLLMLPFSEAYSYIILFGAFYIPHMILVFLILGILAGQLNDRHQSTWLILVGGILSFVGGLGGPRLPLILFMPIGTIVAIKILFGRFSRSKPFLLTGAGFCLSALCGYAANVFYLSRHYTYQSFSHLRVSTAYIRRIFSTGKTFIAALSDRSSSIFTIVASLVLIFILICFILIFKDRKKRTDRDNTMALMVFLSAGYIGLVYLLTNMKCVDWYFVPLIILFVPLVHITFKHYSIKKTVYILMTLLVLTCGIRGYINFDHWRLRTARILPNAQNVVKLLTENGYHNGYAEFWNANILTELSDGEIDVWTIKTPDQIRQVEGASLFHKGNLHQWLQLSDHLKKSPQGKVFFLMRTENPFHFEGIDTMPIIYQSDDRIIYDVSSLFADK